ncbi:hypothetical protein FEM48_Zijuj09G0105900 [Ziziphus jujuba var. spinosa]|uniref:Organ-specific protein S2-like n=1 Tax=Ziziphus jujuba var. spinosa TaxID=714518 RepID=A0A978USI0_ZIZJJ|nr:hypothetical protein FEM48_Zijuj09G0105900 [Ziziphus jujuba var. spinosa]
MKSASAILVLLSLLLYFNTIESRKDPAEYWRSVMKKQPMPEAIHGLVQSDSTTLVPKRQDFNEKTDCHEKVKSFADNFESRPNISAKHDDNTKTFSDNFEPTTNNSAYHEDDTKSKDDQNVGTKEAKPAFAEDFEPRPNLSVYNE